MKPAEADLAHLWDMLRAASVSVPKLIADLERRLPPR